MVLDKVIFEKIKTPEPGVGTHKVTIPMNWQTILKKSNIESQIPDFIKMIFKKDTDTVINDMISGAVGAFLQKSKISFFIRFVIAFVIDFMNSNEKETHYLLTIETNGLPLKNNIHFVKND